MSGISRSGLLVTAGVAAVILLELRTLLGMFGIDIDPLVHLVGTVVAVALLVVVLDWYPRIAGRTGGQDGTAN
ncbi:hypothetical protein AArcCO_1983 [Halalkaliarchaeum sp. AArc-CO]|uniref:hypothetical protein n=1 Tax=unclassified Halalkaliarchaeum TaxID=2678344 RepID=UPI00217DB2D0|nr:MULTISPECIES: hypothetical protein [unclassified Halalkaliarchaeum]MDR5671784.1 hypothetical protein [Halalkaliarchaeum sp. AArc-GB]UWG51280.1 hypothetical protein AArcCO_1983 [Halalkaliarchaeum sp. AArc-CO]